MTTLYLYRYFAAYVEDKPYLEYLVSIQMNCSLRLVGKPFGVSGYGIALPKNSPLTARISETILDLQDKNVLSQLWRKWAVRKCVNREEFQILPESMALNSVSGLFVVVACAIVFSGILVAVENAAWYLHTRYRDSKNLQQDVSTSGDEDVKGIRMKKRKSTKRKDEWNSGFTTSFGDLDLETRLQMKRDSVYFIDDMNVKKSNLRNWDELVRANARSRWSIKRGSQDSQV